MNIRKMTITDYDKVYKLWRAVPGIGLNEADDSREGINKYLKRNPDTCFVAEKEDIVIGAILCGHDGRRGFIYHMAVAESEQRRGVGEALLKHAIEALKAEGIRKAALVVFRNNVKGNSFWEKQGFQRLPVELMLKENW